MTLQPDEHLPDLRTVWADPGARDLVTQVLRNGMFRKDVPFADLLLAEIERVVASDAPNRAVYETLNDFLHEPPHADRFKDLYAGDDGARSRRRVAQILEILGDTPPPRNVVDIGCGTGAMTAALAETWGLARLDAVGIDVFDRSQAADRYTHLTFDGDRIPLEDNSVALALIMMVLHHEDEPEGLLREAARILEPGGRLFVRECDSETPSRMLFNDLMDHLYYQVLNDLSVIPNPANHRPASHCVPSR
jgi:SAM-dependent methyltransferase